MTTAPDSLSQAEQDAVHAHLCARNCLIHEDRPGPKLLNVGTELKPLRIPQSEAWQQSYSMHVLIECEGDHARLLAARKICAERQDPNPEVRSRAVDLCDQALRMVEGAGAVSNDGARQILLAVCEYETTKTAIGVIGGVNESSTRTLTEALRSVNATMADVPSPETLVSWAFPWL
jgi:hypothetical protein